MTSNHDIPETDDAKSCKPSIPGESMSDDFHDSPVQDLTDDEIIDIVATRILKRHKKAFLELAK